MSTRTPKRALKSPRKSWDSNRGFIAISSIPAKKSLSTFPSEWITELWKSSPDTACCIPPCAGRLRLNPVCFKRFQLRSAAAGHLDDLEVRGGKFFVWGRERRLEGRRV